MARRAPSASPSLPEDRDPLPARSCETRDGGRRVAVPPGRGHRARGQQQCRAGGRRGGRAERGRLVRGHPGRGGERPVRDRGAGRAPGPQPGPGGRLRRAHGRRDEHRVLPRPVRPARAARQAGGPVRRGGGAGVPARPGASGPEPRSGPRRPGTAGLLRVRRRPGRRTDPLAGRCLGRAAHRRAGRTRAVPHLLPAARAAQPDPRAAAEALHGHSLGPQGPLRTRAG